MAGSRSTCASRSPRRKKTSTTAVPLRLAAPQRSGQYNSLDPRRAALVEQTASHGVELSAGSADVVVDNDELASRPGRIMDTQRVAQLIAAHALGPGLAVGGFQGRPGLDDRAGIERPAAASIGSSCRGQHGLGVRKFLPA